MFAVSPRLIALNLLLLGVAAFFGYELMREVSAPRPLPGRPVARAPQTPLPGAGVSPEAAARPDQRGQYGIVASKNLFSPSRTDVVATGADAPGQPATPRPVLHGVVLDDARSRAYLEDPTTKRVFGYALGDSVGGGKLETIRADRVGIVRPEGVVEVMLRDPSKPPPVPVTAGAQPPATNQPTVVGSPFPAIRPGVAGSPAPGMPGMVAPPPLPAPVAPPRPLQSIPSDFLRRPTVPPRDATPR